MIPFQGREVVVSSIAILYRAHAKKTGSSFALYEEYARFVSRLPTQFDVTPSAGRQEQIKVFPDKTQITVAYSPANGWDDLTLMSTLWKVYIEHRRKPVNECGKVRDTFELARVTIEEQGRKQGKLREFKLLDQDPSEAKREFSDFLRRKINEIYSVRDLNALAERLFQDGPGIVQRHKPAPAP